jgi:hypothetical protein
MLPNSVEPSKLSLKEDQLLNSSTSFLRLHLNREDQHRNQDQPPSKGDLLHSPDQLHSSLVSSPPWELLLNQDPLLNKDDQPLSRDGLLLVHSQSGLNLVVSMMNLVNLWWSLKLMCMIPREITLFQGSSFSS